MSDRQTEQKEKRSSRRPMASSTVEGAGQAEAPAMLYLEMDAADERSFVPYA